MPLFSLYFSTMFFCVFDAAVLASHRTACGLLGHALMEQATLQAVQRT